MTELVEAVPYKPEGRGFDSRWCHWNCSFTLSFRSHYGPDVDSAPNRNEYREYFLGGKGGRCVGLIPHHMPTIWKSGSHNHLEPSGLVTGLYRDSFTFYLDIRPDLGFLSDMFVPLIHFQPRIIFRLFYLAGMLLMAPQCQSACVGNELLNNHLAVAGIAVYLYLCDV